jgi:formylglycine-generating enzyme required for sulfatase activity
LDRGPIPRDERTHYYRTYTNAGNGPTGEADPATVSGFRLDKYPVTVGRFRQYLNYLTSPTGTPPANGSGKHTHLNGGLGLADSSNPGTYETGWNATGCNAYVASGPASVIPE